MSAVTRILKSPCRCISCPYTIKVGEQAIDHDNGIREHVLCSQLNTDYKGEVGKLEIDVEGRLRCHVCGWFMNHLGRHVYLRHNMTAEDYREAYGLNRTTPLCSKDISRHRATIALQNQLEGKFPSGEDGRLYLPHPPHHKRRHSARAEEILHRRAHFVNPLNNPEYAAKALETRRRNAKLRVP